MATHRQKYLKKMGLDPKESYSIPQLSKISGVPISILKEIYSRGEGAWGSNISSVRLKKDFSKNPDTSTYPRSARLTKEQWAFGRIYSFLNKGKTYTTADSDLAKKISY
jgi:hypothetical protein